MNKYYLMALFVLYGYCAVYAQNIPVSVERQLNLNALQILDSYEENSGISTAEEKYNFVSLFADKNMEICNDLIGLSKLQDITVAEYANTLNLSGKYPRSEITNVKKEKIIENNDEWIITITFDKNISYTTPCGVLLSSKEYYGTDYHMTMDVALNKMTKECRIKSLQGKVQSTKPNIDLSEYYVVSHESPYHDAVRCNGVPLEFNSFRQAFVPRNYSFSFADPDVLLKVKVDDTDCNNMQLTFIPRHWRVKGFVNFALGNVFRYDNNITTIDDKSSLLHFGMDFGYVFPSSGKLKLGAFIGVGIAQSNIKFGINELNYQYNATSAADIDGDSYTRCYELKNFTAQISQKDICIPIYLDGDYNVSQTFSIYGQLGLRTYLNIASEYNEYSADMYVYGIYPQYSNLRLDEHWGFNGFGPSRLELDNLYSKELDTNKYSADAFIGLGCRMKISGPLFLDIGANYQFGLNDCFSSVGSGIIIDRTDVSRENALVTYTLAEGEKAKGITNAYSNIKRKALSVNVGLILKF